MPASPEAAVAAPAQPDPHPSEFAAQLEHELERRLTLLEQGEAHDPVHAALSGRTLAVFLGTATAVVVGAAIWAVL